MADLHGNGDQNNDLVVLEFEEIKHQVYFERTEGAKSYLDLLKPGILRRVGLGCSLQMWSQLSGMNVMMWVTNCFLRPSSVSCYMLICLQVLHYLRFPRCRPYGKSWQSHRRLCPICPQCRFHHSCHYLVGYPIFNQGSFV